MIKRELFREEHESFRDSVRRFIDCEVKPHHYQWEQDGVVPRDIWLKAGAAGLLCCTVPEEYGGLGLDYLFNVVLFEELAKSGFTGPGFLIHCDLVATYIHAYGSEAQKRRWLPKMVRGEAIGSLAMAQPYAGSDFEGLRAVAVRHGDDFVIDGERVFIPNGRLCNLMVLPARTGDATGTEGISLFLVDTGLLDPTHRRDLDKLGLRAQDTSELSLKHLRVPASAILGAEGSGSALTMTKLPQERLAQAVCSASVAEEVIDYTIRYVSQRKAFGKSIADFQNTQFKLAELKTEATIGRVFTDHCIRLFMDGGLDAIDGAMAKMWLSNLHCKVVDECLQLFGGWGYMWEYPIARAYVDARMVKIGGGSIETMKYIIGRSMTGQGAAVARGNRP